MRTPIQDGNTSIGPQWQRMNIECLCVVCSVCIAASVFAAFGVRTLQLCFCIVASVYVAVVVRTLKLCFCFVASLFVAVGVRTLQLCSHIIITPKNSSAAPTVIYPTNHMLHNTHTLTTTCS